MKALLEDFAESIALVALLAFIGCACFARSHMLRPVAYVEAGR